MDALPVNDALTIPVDCLSWTAVRAAGPGGQNVNKVSSKVDLRLNLDRWGALTGAQRERLRQQNPSKFDAEGRLVVLSQLTRDQPRNLEDARDKMAALIRAALVVPKARRATRPTFGSKMRRLEGKKMQSEKKKNRTRED
ncbi:MAG: alternative ribosome rescue aminoacyl-tRNA hydrolase ArfB [Deltaproteobacteria bacterium]|nr:alternative ribosome rescue aminoacyl-tRNA hydrolase ArfB [Deltaproteobacteria bacterium]